MQNLKLNKSRRIRKKFDKKRKVKHMNEEKEFEV